MRVKHGVATLPKDILLPCLDLIGLSGRANLPNKDEEKTGKKEGLDGKLRAVWSAEFKWYIERDTCSFVY